MKAYSPSLPAQHRQQTWDDVLAELGRNAELRPDSLIDYRTVLQLCQRPLPQTVGPTEVTADLAKKFKPLLQSTPCKRGDKEKESKRTPNTVRSTLIKLRSLWNKPLQLPNVWDGVPARTNSGTVGWSSRAGR